MLEQAIKQQLKTYFDLLESDLILTVSLKDGDAKSGEIDTFVREVAELSARISVRYEVLERSPSFRIDRPESESRITFAAVPIGHEL